MFGKGSSQTELYADAFEHFVSEPKDPATATKETEGEMFSESRAQAAAWRWRTDLEE